MDEATKGQVDRIWKQIKVRMPGGKE